MTPGQRVLTEGPRPVAGTIRIDRRGSLTVYLDRAIPVRNAANKVTWRRQVPWDPQRFQKAK